ncbi:MAG: D-glycero-beta-D-manno-heptose 1,7-bisphosphate 7-phosphatase [Gammaproteobacteria bacterium]|nr:D-glycero-beta-D-manno-heptose 1,7-bisphosphate 7-phosphatase [Gammaproteobacteria bacterium]
MTRQLTHKGLVILDRDGVINRDSSSFVKSPNEWIPLSGSIRAIAALSNSGYTVTVASNQSGLARGLLDRSALRAMHRKLRKLVAAEGGHVDRIVICPHGPDDDCDCRKPKPGLLHRLGRYYGIALTGVPVIGDSLRDLQAATAVGARPILVRTGNGQATELALDGELEATEVFDDLAAVAAMLARE